MPLPVAALQAEPVAALQAACVLHPPCTVDYLISAYGAQCGYTSPGSGRARRAVVSSSVKTFPYDWLPAATLTAGLLAVLTDLQSFYFLKFGNKVINVFL